MKIREELLLKHQDELTKNYWKQQPTGYKAVELHIILKGDVRFRQQERVIMEWCSDKWKPWTQQHF